jgi:hypothetical protein
MNEGSSVFMRLVYAFGDEGASLALSGFLKTCIIKCMHKSGCTAFVLLCFLNFGIHTEVIDRIVHDALDQVARNVETPLVVSVGNITYADKGIASPFSQFMRDALGRAMSAHGEYELFDREKLDEILEVQKLSLSGLFDEAGTAEIGKLKGINGIFSGRFFDDGDMVRVFLELTSVETGTVKGSVDVKISKTEIPHSVSVLPRNYTDALYVLEELAEVRNSHNDEFVVRAWSTRGDGGVYRDGEYLVVNFFANRSCYLKIFHVDVNGDMSLIFPNRYFGANRVEGNRVYRIPDSSYPFRFRLHEPYGVEYIKIIASTVQFDDVEEAFTDLGRASKGIVTRGLSVDATESQITETLFSYTIVE